MYGHVKGDVSGRRVNHMRLMRYTRWSHYAKPGPEVARVMTTRPSALPRCTSALTSL
ncbi:hypothetical protein BC827DRAFT_1201691, partial [Russula dissimulans]